MERLASDLECCGNGCNNCVLDTNPSQERPNDAANKTNVLSSTYVLFSLVSVNQCTGSVFQLEFKFDQNQNKSFSKDNFYLNIPLANYLMLRATYVPHRQISPDFRNLQYGDEGSELLNVRKDKHDQETCEDFISRPYTPIDVNGNNLTFKILVKFVKHGLMSQYIASLKLGDLTEWKGSYGHFEYIPNKYNSLIFITQGVGIAPVYRILKVMLNDKADETRVHVLACFKDMENILLRNDLYNMKQFWNFNNTIYLSRPKDVKPKYNEIIKMGRLNEIEISNFLNSSKFFNNNSTFIICGSETFSNSIKTNLLHLCHNNFVIL